jgi:hypothetical protein
MNQEDAMKASPKYKGDFSALQLKKTVVKKYKIWVAERIWQMI